MGYIFSVNEKWWKFAKKRLTYARFFLLERSRETESCHWNTILTNSNVVKNWFKIIYYSFLALSGTAKFFTQNCLIHFDWIEYRLIKYGKQVQIFRRVSNSIVEAERM